MYGFDLSFCYVLLFKIGHHVNTNGLFLQSEIYTRLSILRCLRRSFRQDNITNARFYTQDNMDANILLDITTQNADNLPIHDYTKSSVDTELPCEINDSNILTDGSIGETTLVCDHPSIFDSRNSLFDILENERASSSINYSDFMSENNSGKVSRKTLHEFVVPSNEFSSVFSSDDNFSITEHKEKEIKAPSEGCDKIPKSYKIKPPRRVSKRKSANSSSNATLAKSSQENIGININDQSVISNKLERIVRSVGEVNLGIKNCTNLNSSKGVVFSSYHSETREIFLNRTECEQPISSWKNVSDVTTSGRIIERCDDTSFMSISATLTTSDLCDPHCLRSDIHKSWNIPTPKTSTFISNISTQHVKASEPKLDNDFSINIQASSISSVFQSENIPCICSYSMSLDPVTMKSHQNSSSILQDVTNKQPVMSHKFDETNDKNDTIYEEEMDQTLCHSTGIIEDEENHVYLNEKKKDKICNLKSTEFIVSDVGVTKGLCITDTNAFHEKGDKMNRNTNIFNLSIFDDGVLDEDLCNSMDVQTSNNVVGCTSDIIESSEHLSQHKCILSNITTENLIEPIVSGAAPRISENVRVLRSNSQRHSLSLVTKVLKKKKPVIVKTNPNKQIKSKKMKISNIDDPDLYTYKGKDIRKPNFPLLDYWCNPRLYNYLIQFMKIKYGIQTNRVVVDLVQDMYDEVNEAISKVSNFQDNVQNVKKMLWKNNVISTTSDFHEFVKYYTPVQFRVRVIPSVCCPFEEVKFDFATVNEPLTTESFK